MSGCSDVSYYRECVAVELEWAGERWGIELDEIPREGSFCIPSRSGERSAGGLRRAENLRTAVQVPSALLRRQPMRTASKA